MNQVREIAIFEQLGKLESFCSKSQIQYAVFGGVATAAFLGELIRSVHDIDVVVARKQQRQLDLFFKRDRFVFSPTDMSIKAGYKRYVKRTRIAELVVQVFPGEFVLLDITKSNPRPMWKYEFSQALKRAQKKELWSLDRSKKIHVNVISFEDLVFSKLWHFFEPNMMFDLALLLGHAEDEGLEWQYFRSLVDSAPLIMKHQCIANLHQFERIISTSTMFRNFAKDISFSRCLAGLQKSFTGEHNPKQSSEFLQTISS
jgi:hypothetical protein